MAVLTGWESLTHGNNSNTAYITETFVGQTAARWIQIDLPTTGIGQSNVATALAAKLAGRNVSVPHTPRDRRFAEGPTKCYSMRDVFQRRVVQIGISGERGMRMSSNTTASVRVAPRVDDGHSRSSEWHRIPCRHGEPMYSSNCADLGVSH
jgi:hypothetical protein